MHLFGGKKGILRPKNGLVFKLMPQLAAVYPGPTPSLPLVYLTLPVAVVLGAVLAGCSLQPPLQHTPDFDFSVPPA
jgi:hypothetical protein